MAKLSLHWPVCRDGYRIERRGGGTSRAAKTLAAGSPGFWIVRESGRNWPEPPDVMQIAGLYHRLAAFDPNEKGALAFVTKYGFLFSKSAREESVDDICHRIEVVRSLVKAKRARNLKAIDEWLALNGGTIRLTATLGVGQSPRMFFEPHRLIDAIILQFFRDLETGANLRLCARTGCGEWFAYGPGTHPPRRETALYCSPRCQKANAYVRLKGEAS